MRRLGPMIKTVSMSELVNDNVSNLSEAEAVRLIQQLIGMTVIKKSKEELNKLIKGIVEESHIGITGQSTEETIIYLTDYLAKEKEELINAILNNSDR